MRLHERHQFECLYRKSNVFVEKAIISVDHSTVRCSVHYNAMNEKCNSFPAYNTHRFLFKQSEHEFPHLFCCYVKLGMNNFALFPGLHLQSEVKFIK